MVVTAKIEKLEDGKLVLKPDTDISRFVEQKRPRRVEVRLDDGRTISVDQRRKIFAIIRDISLWSGHEPEELRQYLEWDFCSRAMREWFSLSDCDMTTAREFITYLISFCFHWGVPTKDSLLTQTDDIGKYLYLCLENRRCAICNRPAEVHHVDRIGMGMDRESRRFTGGTLFCRTGFRSLRRSMARMKGGRGTMTEAECRAEIRKFFMELYPACTVIYAYPGNAARPPAPYVVLDFDAADSSQIDEYVDDWILQQTWYMSMPFSAELVAQSKVVHGGGVKKALLSTAVDDLAQSIRFFQSSYAEDKMRLLNISVTATGNPEQIHNSVSGVERARCSFSVDFVQNTKEYAALHPQDGAYIADHDSAASKELADMQAGYFTEVEIEPQIKE